VGNSFAYSSQHRGARVETLVDIFESQIHHFEQTDSRIQVRSEKFPVSMEIFSYLNLNKRMKNLISESVCCKSVTGGS